MKILYTDFMADLLLAINDEDSKEISRLVEEVVYVPFEDVGYNKDEFMCTVYDLCLTYGKNPPLLSSICSSIYKNLGFDYDFSLLFELRFGKSNSMDSFEDYIGNNAMFDNVLSSKAPRSIKMELLKGVLGLLISLKELDESQMESLRKYNNIKKKLNAEVLNG